MTDINELTAKLKAAALKAKSATEDYAAGRISITTCYSECAEFNSLTDGPDQILPLTEALEAAERRIAELEERKDDLVRQARSFREAHDSASKIISQLEARTLTVKLPKTFFYEHDDLSSDVAVLDKRLVKKSLREACAAAGIKLQIEGE